MENEGDLDEFRLPLGWQGSCSSTSSSEELGRNGNLRNFNDFRLPLGGKLRSFSSWTLALGTGLPLIGGGGTVEYLTNISGGQAYHENLTNISKVRQYHTNI